MTDGGTDTSSDRGVGTRSSEPLTVDTAFELLSDCYRRQLLVALLERHPRAGGEMDPLGPPVEMGETIADRAFEISVFHNHLPKLDATGVIDWNRDTDRVSRGDNWEDIVPLLQMLQDQQDALPADWL